ncbi:cytochrome P450 [Parafrankia sp. EAN1pec]|uniref:cytochrome P450 n=1 Tax=Parafrankia sp. (strain EAN1pec) TaxID=298653 RepID=UPI0000543A0D|nr:cytochrome P450 [Frankia sp. EAN1pec]
MSTVGDRELNGAVGIVHTSIEAVNDGANPYQTLAPLHDYGEAVIMPEGYLAVWGHQACMDIMRSSAWGRHLPDSSIRAAWQHDLTAEQAELLRQEEPPHIAPWLQTFDGPEHARQRSLVSKPFTPRRLQVMRQRTTEVVGRLAAAAPRGVPFDFMSTIAFPIPNQVVGELVGLPLQDRDWFAERAVLLLAERDPRSSFDQLRRSTRAIRELGDYIRGLLRGETCPTEGLASDLLEAEETGARLTEPELLSLMLLMYVAGHGTTAHSMGNGLYVLLQHPDQLAALRADRGLTRSAVEEILRWDSGVTSVDYSAVEDTDIDGIRVPAGTPAHLFLSAANRDPRVYTDPGSFDIRRTEGPTVVFGAGPHFCLGAALARLELEIALDVLLAGFASIELATSTPPRGDSFNYRYFTQLPIVVSDN